MTAVAANGFPRNQTAPAAWSFFQALVHGVRGALLGYKPLHHPCRSTCREATNARSDSQNPPCGSMTLPQRPRLIDTDVRRLAIRYFRRCTPDELAELFR